MNRKEFFDKYYGIAKLASSELGGKLDPFIVLSFWHWETAGGTNRGSKKLNNLAGIKWVDQKRKYGIEATQSGMYANYANLEEFAKDYARVLNLGYYKDVLTAGVTSGYEDDVVAINLSPYAEADYDLKTVIDNTHAFRLLSGQASVVDGQELITIPNKSGMSKDEILKAIAVGIAFITTISLLND
jgi:hypothetical protein